MTAATILALVLLAVLTFAWRLNVANRRINAHLYQFNHDNPRVEL